LPPEGCIPIFVCIGKRSRAVLGLAALLTLGACATRPPQPAMVAQSQQGDFGYSETKLATDRFEVRYATPDVPLPVDEDRKIAALTDQKQRAYDLALWRAAQIALAGGYGALRIEQEHRDANVTVRRETVPVATGAYGSYGPGDMLYPGWAYNPHYYHGHHGFYGHHGFGTPFWFYSDPFAYETRLSVSARINASLVAAFAKAPGPESLDAGATAQRLAKQYAGATY
jgi:hypothetical protein